VYENNNINEMCNNNIIMCMCVNINDKILIVMCNIINIININVCNV